MPPTAIAAVISTEAVPNTTSGREVSSATEGRTEGGTPVTSSPKITAAKNSEGSTDALGEGDDWQPPQGK